MSMTVQQFLNGIIYVGAVAMGIMSIGTIAHYMIVKPMRKFLQKEIGGVLVSIREAIEVNTKVTKDLDDRLTAHISNGGHYHSSIL